ncbi:MAG: hypothetical protein ACLQT7_05660 [Candidatus Dormibacteria bacterium]
MTARPLLHALAIAVLGAAVGLGGSAARLFPAASTCTAAAYSGHVTLVVEHGDARVIGLCIGFDGSSITGEEILQASGLEYATAGYATLGDAVCQIDDEPAAYTSCLPSSGPYWVVFVARGGGAWQAGGNGISTETFASGDAEGFRYDPQEGADPPPASPAGICAAALGGSSTSPAGSQSGGASGSGGGAGSGGAPSPASTPTPAGSAVAVGSGEPSAAVIAPVTGSTALASASSGVSPGLIVVAAVFGALVGLLVVQLWLRRRRT